MVEFVETNQILHYQALRVGEKLFPGMNLLEDVEAALRAMNWVDDGPYKISGVMAVWLVLMAAMYRDQSIRSVFDKCLCLFPGLADKALDDVVTTDAAYKARKRLGAGPVKELFERTVKHLTSYPTFFGLRIVILDSTKFNTRDTDANAAFFGRPSNGQGLGGFPQGQAGFLVTAYDCKIRAMKVLPGNTDEHNAAFGFLDHLLTTDLFISDRGIPSARLLRDLRDRKIPFLARIPNDWNVTFVRKLGEGDSMVRILRNDDKPGQEPLELRLIEFTLTDHSGERQQVRLLTALMQIPKREFVSLYHERWRVETTIGGYKNVLLSPRKGQEPFIARSKTPDLVEQELYAAAIVNNLIREIGSRQAEKVGSTPNDFSFSGWYDTTRTNVEAQFNRTKPLSLLRSSHRHPKRKPNRRCPRTQRLHRHRFPFRKGRLKQAFYKVEPDFRTTGRTLAGSRSSS